MCNVIYWFTTVRSRSSSRVQFASCVPRGTKQEKRGPAVTSLTPRVSTAMLAGRQRTHRQKNALWRLRVDRPRVRHGCIESIFPNLCGLSPRRKGDDGENDPEGKREEKLASRAEHLRPVWRWVGFVCSIGGVFFFSLLLFWSDGWMSLGKRKIEMP